MNYQIIFQFTIPKRTMKVCNTRLQGKNVKERCVECTYAATGATTTPLRCYADAISGPTFVIFIYLKYNNIRKITIEFKHYTNIRKCF